MHRDGVAHVIPHHEGPSHQGVVHHQHDAAQLSSCTYLITWHGPSRHHALRILKPSSLGSAINGLHSMLPAMRTAKKNAAVGLTDRSVHGQEDVAEQAAILDGCAAQDQGPRKTMEDTYILRNSLPLSEFSWSGRPPARSGLYAVCFCISPIFSWVSWLV